ncbi:MAG: hypothetical protein HYU36_19040 [Planctomycetes bacterium]|nr:hypothetical protein [Planctomycetota bacterium]
MKASTPYSREELFGLGRRRTFTGEALAQIAFPLGGIGTGTVSLGGRGQLRDWEIFNRPAKGKNLPMTFFAVWAQADGLPAVAKILERRLLPPFTGSGGHDRSGLGGVARLDEAAFRGEYPFARIDFRDADLPVRVRLEAFNPFIPLRVEDSSIPAALFQWTFENRSGRPVALSLLSTMQNPVGWQDIGVETKPFPPRLNQFREEEPVRGLWFWSPELKAEDPNQGTAALMTTWPDVDVQTRLYRGGWWDSAHLLWDDFAADGRLEHRIESTYRQGEKPAGTERPEVGALALRTTVAPGGSVTLPVAIAWHFPFIKCWTENIIARTAVSRQFRDAWDAGRTLFVNLDRLESGSRRWHGALFSSTLPPFVLDAVSSQASIFRTQTCFRLADGQFYGWEGCSDDRGCCHGTCTHVWNYEQTLAFLFPSLERSIRRNEFLNSVSPDGHMQFRSSAPANVRMGRFHACGDGQMGAVIRAYRDWQLSGDDAFLREIWPNVKKAVEYAWTGGWDADRDGVMEGCQHNTYDIEFYGPNTMMGAMYLGALRAAEEMALALGEAGKAREYRTVFESGRARMDAELWNGEYYIQKVEVKEGLEVPEHLRGPAACGAGCACRETPSPASPPLPAFEVKYQYGDGCLSDQLLGQWAAHVAGLGYLLDPARVRQAVLHVFRYNFQKPIGSFSNVQRIYALNDEAGLLLCSWPRGSRPKLPFVYSDEVWTGIEYQVAAHLIFEGLVAEGLAIVKGVRDRHDGLRRNPWDEFECGHHYARAMSSWSVLLALSGFSFQASRKAIAFRPRLGREGFRTFFSTGQGWGTFQQKASAGRFEVVLALLEGGLELGSLAVLPPKGFAADGRVQASADRGPVPAEASASGEGWTIVFPAPVRLAAGETLKVRLAASAGRARR